MIDFVKAPYGKALSFLTAWVLDAKLDLSEYVNQILAVLGL